jgi:hypothetical protein
LLLHTSYLPLGVPNWLVKHHAQGRLLHPHHSQQPLTQLLTKKGFQWNDQAQAAFDELKLAMVNTRSEQFY